jgi:hypothetical protein
MKPLIFVLLSLSVQQTVLKYSQSTKVTFLLNLAPRSRAKTERFGADCYFKGDGEWWLAEGGTEFSDGVT